MAVQKRNDDMMNFIRGEFQARYEQAFHFSHAVSSFLALSGLRGFWPMSAFGSTGQAFDQSGNVRTLTNNNTAQFNYEILRPFCNYNGTTQYHSRADEAGLDIIGTETYVDSSVRGLSLIAWIYPGRTTNFEHVIGKWNPSTNNKSYRIVNDSGTFTGQISTDGSTTFAVGGDSVTANAWQFVALTFDPSTTLNIWLNSDKTSNAVAVPATLFNGNAPFTIAAAGHVADFYQGRVSLCSLQTTFLDDTQILALFNQTRALFNV